MGSMITWIAGAAIVAGASWLGRYAISVRRGSRHDPHAKSVWWSPGQIPTPHIDGNREDEQPVKSQQ